jgi:hypothetical protein
MQKRPNWFLSWHDYFGRFRAVEVDAAVEATHQEVLADLLPDLQAGPGLGDSGPTPLGGYTLFNTGTGLAVQITVSLAKPAFDPEAHAERCEAVLASTRRLVASPPACAEVVITDA